MMAYLNQKRGQSTVEYAVLIIVIIGALIAIQVYIKRGVQGRLKSASDDIGDQFSPGNTNVLMKEKTHSKTQQAFNAGAASTNMLDPESTNSTMRSVVANADQEYWGN